MEEKHFNPGDKVKVTATNAELESMGMTDAKVNRNLRKYESTVSEILVKGGFPDNQGTVHKSVVLDSTWVIPGCWLKLASEEDEEVVIEKEDKKIKDEVKETEETEEEEIEDKDQNND